MSLSNPSTVPLGSLANASSVGAKTVNGPAPLRVSTKLAALIAVTRVLKEPALTAVSIMSATYSPSCVSSINKHKLISHKKHLQIGGCK